MTESRNALIVASRRYSDPKLRRLRSPTHDAKALASVLGDPEIGAFDVHVSLDEPEHAVRRKLAGFFKTRDRDDLLLLHFSCHGVKDEDGNLYFATPDTELEHLDATAVPAEFVNRLMNRSPSRRIVLLLDCCYAGAFGRGALHRAGAGVELKERFDGRGRVVITASNSMEYAFEGDTLTGEGTPSVFTSALVAGLRSGEADRDHDGFVSIDELYEFLYDRVRDETPNQTPSKWTYDLQGDLVVARNPAGAVVAPAALPDALVHAMESPITQVREGSVQALAELLRGSNASLALAARNALETLQQDDSRRVSLAAEYALASSTPAAVTATPAVREAPGPVRRATPSPSPAGPVRRVRVATEKPNAVVALTGAGSLCLLVAAGSIVLESNALGSAQALFGGTIVTALLAPLVALAWARARLRAELAVGLLLGVAIYTSGAALGWVGAGEGPGNLLKSVEDAFLDLGLLRVFFPLAAAALLAGALLARRARTEWADVPPAGMSGRAVLLACGGALLCFVALFLPFRFESGDRHMILGQGAVSAPWVGFEPVGALLVIGVVATAGWLALSNALVRTGLLLALGAQTFLYFLSYVLSVHQHAPGNYGPGGFAGMLGAAAVVAAGVLQLRAALARPQDEPSVKTT